MNKYKKIILIAILILAATLRLYKIDSIPPSLTWDEAAVGYNAWTIANYGRDEYGKLFPLYFRSFGEGKNPVDIYFTAISTLFLGLSEFSTRLPSALFGILNVLLIYFFVKVLFKSELIGLIASFFLAISPYNLHFSRFNHEANFALFFFMLGFLFFYLSVENQKKNSLLPFSIISFSLSFISYSAAKVIVPLFFTTLFILYIKKIIKMKVDLLLAIFFLFLFMVLLFLQPSLLGFTRYKEAAIGDPAVKDTKTYKDTNNLFLGRAEIYLNQYSKNFSPEFLFTRGDKNSVLSYQKGEFYKIDVIFLILGLLYLLRKRSRAGLLILVWAAFAPIPSSIAGDAPHAGRSMFTMGSWQIISALGFFFLINLVRKKYLKIGVGFAGIIILTFLVTDHMKYYLTQFSKDHAINWQYGMKQIALYVKDHPEYREVVMTDKRAQPYIFFLYYLKTPLPEYLKTVVFNPGESSSFNNVTNYGKYYFNSSNLLETFPRKEVLVVATPQEYDGLNNKISFDIKSLILYPSGGDAFYIVSGK